MQNKGNDRFRRLKRLIWSRIRRVQHVDIEDVAQEAHVRLLRLLERGGSVRDPEAYVNRIAINVANDFAASDSRERKFINVDSEELENCVNSAEAAEWAHNVYDAVDLEQEIEWLTKHLPQRQRDALILCERDELTYEEAAERLGVSVVTVGRWIADAKARCQVRAKRRITRGTVK